MDARKLIIVLLCCALPALAAAETVQVSYCFGKVELLRQGNLEWEFLKRGTALNEHDRVRTPPISILRLALEDGTALPAFTGARESTVRQLVEKGHDRLSRAQNSRIETPFHGDVAIDVLPTGAPVPKAQEPPKSHESIFVDAQILGQLRTNLLPIPRDVSEQATEWSAEWVGPDYAPRAFQIAQVFYTRFLGELETAVTTDDILRYAQLLASMEIDVQFEQAPGDTLLLLVNPEIQPEAIKMLTVNRDLVISRGSQMWVPLQIRMHPSNFILAWYYGARASRAIQAER